MSLGIGIPESTAIITLTSVGLAIISNVAVRLLVDLNKERRLRREVTAFDKELRQAMQKKDKDKEEKLKKKKPQIDKMRLSMSTGRLKATFVTYIPFLLIYYGMANLVFSGISTQVAFAPIPIPYIVSAKGTMALFWWYSLSSFSFSFVIQKLMGTSITT